ncbi:MAG: hypothetical protein V3575_03695 [Candidatus Absconditabacteria bacterium]
MSQKNLTEMKLKEYYMYVIGFRTRGVFFHFFLGVFSFGLYWVFMMLQRESFIKVFLYLKRRGVSHRSDVKTSRWKLFADFIYHIILFILNPIWIFVNMSIVNQYSRVSNKLSSRLLFMKIIVFLFWMFVTTAIYIDNNQIVNKYIFMFINYINKINFVLPNNIASVYALLGLGSIILSVILSAYIIVFYFMLYKIDKIIERQIDENLQLIPENEKISNRLNQLQ